MQNRSISEKLHAHYDTYYDGQIEWRRLGAIDKAAQIVALSSAYPHETVLEIGAGEGAILQRLAELKFGSQLYGIEISSSALAVLAQRKIPTLVESKLFDGEHIPYASDQFDLAVLSHVVEHVEHPRQLLYEARRVATHVYIEVPLEDNIRLTQNFVFDPTGHINFYSPKTIRRLVQSCGLRIVAQTIYNPSYPIYRYQHGHKALLRFLPKELLLRFLPGVAPMLYTYHCALFCAREQS